MRFPGNTLELTVAQAAMTPCPESCPALSLPAHFLGQLPSYDQARGGGEPQAIPAQGEATRTGITASGLPEGGSAGLFDFSLSDPASFLLSQVWIPKEHLH